MHAPYTCCECVAILQSKVSLPHVTWRPVLARQIRRPAQQLCHTGAPEPLSNSIQKQNDKKRQEGTPRGQLLSVPTATCSRPRMTTASAEPTRHYLALLHKAFTNHDKQNLKARAPKAAVMQKRSQSPNRDGLDGNPIRTQASRALCALHVCCIPRVPARKSCMLHTHAANASRSCRVKCLSLRL